MILFFLPTGSFPRKVHRHRILAAILQAHPEQATGPQRPGVNRSGVLQLPHVDQVSAPTCKHSRNVLLCVKCDIYQPQTFYVEIDFKSYTFSWTCFNRCGYIYATY